MSKVQEVIIISDNQELVDTVNLLEGYEIKSVVVELDYTNFNNDTRLLIVDFDSFSVEKIANFPRFQYPNVDLLGVISSQTTYAIRDFKDLIDDFVVFPCSSELLQYRIKQLKISRHSLANQLSMIRFDTRSGLSSIMGYSEIMKSSLSGNIDFITNDLIEYSEIISENAKSIIRQIDLILMHSRVKNSLFGVHKRQIDLCTLLEEYVSESRRFNPQLITLQLKSHVESLDVIADSWAVQELVTNSIDFLIWFSSELAQLEITVEKRKQFALIKLSMDSHTLPEKIMDLWNTSPQFQIVQYIAKAHSEEVRFESGEGVGTTFYFTLPLVE